MSVEIILHLGTYKTGTSSIQQTLRKNSAKLKKSGFLYPLPPSEKMINQHATICDLLNNDSGLSKLNIYLENVKVEAKSAKCRTIIFSTEAFSSLDKNSIIVFLEMLTTVISKNIKSILYFRNIEDYKLSTLSQLIKSPLNNFYNGRFKHQLARRLDYDAIYEKWNITGNKLRILSFDEQRDTVASFFEELEIDVTDLEIPKSLNKSLPFSVLLSLVVARIIRNHDDHEQVLKALSDRNLKKSDLDYLLSNLLCEGINAKVTNRVFDDMRDTLLKKRNLEPLKAEQATPAYNTLKILNELSEKFLNEKV